MLETFFPILLLFLVAVLLATVLVSVSILLGRRTKIGSKGEPYECGVPPVGSTKEPFPVKFYMVAILFVIFDIEVVFFYPWAVVARELGSFGFFSMALFVGILFVGYFYELGRGALKWD